jgi:ADP-ribose pyrophosphatase YjhB (NUDIX family)
VNNAHHVSRSPHTTPYRSIATPITSGFRYCPRCGAPLAEGIRFGRPRRLCSYCGFIHFLDPKVAVGALVSDGHRVLLVRRSVPPRAGYWALPAGYMDGDELPEEALVREVAEETGLQVVILGLQEVVPLGGWTEQRGLLLLYRASPAHPCGELSAHDDVSEVHWFEPEEIPWDHLAFESTGEYLRAWAGRSVD